MIDVCSEDDLLKLKECSAMARAKQMKFHKSNVFATLECPGPETCSSQTLPRSYFGHTSDSANNPEYEYAYCTPNLLKHNQFVQPYPQQETRDKKMSVSMSSNALSKPQSSTSLRALLIKNFRKSSIGNGSQGGNGENSTGRTNISPRGEQNDSFTSRLGAKENIYEDVSVPAVVSHPGIPRFKLEAPKSVRAHRSIESFIDSSIEEEFRSVQTQHERIMAELNLSVEALIMPTLGETEQILKFNRLRDITDHTYDEPVNNRFLSIKSVLHAHQNDNAKACQNHFSGSCASKLGVTTSDENVRPAQFVFPPPPPLPQFVTVGNNTKSLVANEKNASYSATSTLTPTMSVSTTSVLGSCETSCCFYESEPFKQDSMSCNICYYQHTLAKSSNAQIESISDKVKFINSLGKFKLTGLSHTNQQ